MNSRTIGRIALLAALVQWSTATQAGTATTNEPMPQFHFYLEGEALPEGFDPGQFLPSDCTGFNEFQRCATVGVTSTGEVILAGATTTQYFDLQGNQIRVLAGEPATIAVGPDDSLYRLMEDVEFCCNMEIYDAAGTLVRSFSFLVLFPTHLGQMAIDASGLIYIPYGAPINEVIIYENVGGVEQGRIDPPLATNNCPLPGEFGNEGPIAVEDLGDGSLAILHAHGAAPCVSAFVDRYAATGEFLERLADRIDAPVNRANLSVSDDGLILIAGSPFGGSGVLTFFDPIGTGTGFELEADIGALCSGQTCIHAFETQPVRGGRFLADRLVLLVDPDSLVTGQNTNTLRVYRRGYRSVGSNQPPAVMPGEDSAIPLPRVVAVLPRGNTGVVDIDFEIHDFDGASVEAALIGFREGGFGFDSVVRVQTLIEGTDVLLSAPVPANTVHRLTWDAKADFPSESFLDLQLAVVTRKFPSLLDIHFVTLDAGLPDPGDPELLISRIPLSPYDLRYTWYWLLASADPGIDLVDGQVVSTADQSVLADGVTTTPDGLDYLLAMVGLREATASEIQRAREAVTPGTVNQFTPRNTLGGMPRSVNEFSIETGDVTGEVWVVPTP